MMKTNKITLMVMGLALVSLLGSCKKDNGGNNGGTESVKGFTAFTEQGDNGNSKTHGVADGNTIAVQWTADDEILVANQNGNGDQLAYTLNGGADSTEGTFTSEDETSDFLESDFVAIYPATNAAGTANTISGTTATFNLPATQTYLENSFAEKSMPMVAYSSDQSLQFKNVLGGLCCPIVSSQGLRVTKVVVTSAASEALWGTCTTTISTNGDDPTSTVSNTETNKNVITLDCGDGIMLDPNTATDFYIMVPAGTLESGFKVEAYDGTVKIYEKSTATAPGAGFIPRSVVRKVNSNLSIEITVTTISPTFITTHSALAIAQVSHEMKTTGLLYAKASDLNGNAEGNLVVGGSNVTKMTTSTPSTSYEIPMDGLAVDEVYYVRAYAVTQSDITLYGEPIPFATRKDYFGSTYNGMLSGRFTVNANGNQVQFSAGNLQYQASTGTWRFAEYQFEYVGDANNGNVYVNGVKSNNESIASNYSGWIDLFGWGTSGQAHGAVCYQPYSKNNSPTLEEYNAYGAANNNLNNSTGLADWGVYHSSTTTGHGTVIKDGEGHAWRTLQGNAIGGNTAEWNYIVSSRSGNRYSHANLLVRGSLSSTMNYSNYGHAACGTVVRCVILYPDSFSKPTGVKTLRYNGGNINYLTEAEWSLLEQAGCVCLPAAGYRDGNVIRGLDMLLGDYWSATRSEQFNYAHSFQMFGGATSAAVLPYHDTYRCYGLSVRLVSNAN